LKTKPYCDRGHKRTKANLTPSGRCRECNRINQRAARDRARAVREKEAMAAAALSKGEAHDEIREIDGMELDSAKIVRMIEGAIMEVFRNLTPQKYGQATAAQLVAMAEKLIEKRQLLKGEATQIYGTERRQKIDELMPMLIAEAKRRGLDIDLPQSEYQEV
jgi:hypothetical protein